MLFGKEKGKKNQKREETQKTKPKTQFPRANPRPLFSFSPGRTSSPFPVGLISLFLFGPSSAAQLPSFYRLAQLIAFPPPHGWPDPARPASPLSRAARGPLPSVTPHQPSAHAALAPPSVMPAPPVGPFVSAVPRLCLLDRPRFLPRPRSGPPAPRLQPRNHRYQLRPRPMPSRTWHARDG